jgi:hypothetical protein
MKTRRSLPAYTRAPGFPGFSPKPPDKARRIAWVIVAVAAVALAVPIVLSFRDGSAREEAAAESLKMEDIRVAKDIRERQRAAASKAIAEQFERDQARFEDQRQMIEENAGLERARRELREADRELKEAQDAAARPSR